MSLPLTSPAALSDRLRRVLQRVLQQDPVKILTKVLDARDILNRLRDKLRYHGRYEVLDYDATLEILGSKGKKAVLTRREVIRFLQDNVVAVHDHVWGDGELFEKCRCQPGVRVDFYEDGSKWNVLISLRQAEAHPGDDADWATGVSWGLAGNLWPGVDRRLCWL